jgi:hypothetical protein
VSLPDRGSDRATSTAAYAKTNTLLNGSQYKVSGSASRFADWKNIGTFSPDAGEKVKEADSPGCCHSKPAVGSNKMKGCVF